MWMVAKSCTRQGNYWDSYETLQWDCNGITHLATGAGLVPFLEHDQQLPKLDAHHMFFPIQIVFLDFFREIPHFQIPGNKLSIA